MPARRPRIEVDQLREEHLARLHNIYKARTAGSTTVPFADLAAWHAITELEARRLFTEAARLVENRKRWGEPYPADLTEVTEHQFFHTFPRHRYA